MGNEFCWHASVILSMGTEDSIALYSILHFDLGHEASCSREPVATVSREQHLHQPQPAASSTYCTWCFLWANVCLCLQEFGHHRLRTSCPLTDQSGNRTCKQNASFTERQNWRTESFISVQTCYPSRIYKTKILSRSSCKLLFYSKSLSVSERPLLYGMALHH